MVGQAGDLVKDCRIEVIIEKLKTKALLENDPLIQHWF